MGEENKIVERPELPSGDAGSPPALPHTPGPWAVHEEGRSAIIVRNDATVAVCGLARYPMDGRREETVANARLIAAAPELLEAARALLREFEEHRIGYSGDDPAFASLRAAISKATPDPALQDGE